MGFVWRTLLGRAETPHEDLVRHLNILIRARRGAASFLRDYGVEAVDFRTVEEAVVVLGAEIRRILEVYEPRIEVLDLEEEHEGRLILVYRCRLRANGQALAVRVDPRNLTVAVEFAP